MYQSLYRTFRPRTFDEIIGQSAIVQTLKNQILSGRIAHAYLFCGTRGTGKTSAARIMASAVNCQNPQSGNPCLCCESCISVQKERSLDIFEMDAASNSRVEEIRDMLEKVQYPPQFSRYKVYIIDEVHMLSNAAFNALLKTLEEPPDYMIFILATTEPQKLPATILSRCQRFDFGRISEEDIIERLREALDKEIQIEASALQLIAAAAEGSMRDAWSLMEVCLKNKDKLSERDVRETLGTVTKEFLYQFSDALIEKDSSKIYSHIQSIIASGKDAQVFLRDYARLLKNIIAFKLSGNSALYYGNDDNIIRLSKKADLDWLIACLDSCVRAEADSKWSSSPSSVLLLFALKACYLDDANSLLQISARVSELERKAKNLVQRDFDQNTNTSIDITEHNSTTNSDRSLTTQPQAIQSQDASENTVFAEPTGIKTEIPSDRNTEIYPLRGESISEKENDEKNSSYCAPAEADEPADAAHIKQKDSSPRKEGASDTDMVWNKVLRQIKADFPSFAYAFEGASYGGFDGKTFFVHHPNERAFLASILNRDSTAECIAKLLQNEMNDPQIHFKCLLKEEDRKQQENLAAKDLDFLSSMVGRDKIIVK